MNKLKVVTIIGTRPEIIRLSRTIAALDAATDHILVHTGQNFDYELNEIFFSDLAIRKPDHFLEAAGDTASETISNIISSTDKLLAQLAPDAVLILGDTNSSLAVIPAKRRKIPIFHIEAGNRCFDDRVPEEINRRIVDHTADINLTYSSIARQYLLNEGLDPDRVIKVGSPMYEVIEYYRDRVGNSGILEQLDLKEHEFFLVSAHREENVDDETRFRNFIELLNNLVGTFGFPVIVSTHPRTRIRLEKLQMDCNENIRFMKPLAFTDYIKLQLTAKATLSDSGTITEESSILNFPALNIRDTNERPEGMEEGAVMMTGMNLDRIMQGIAILDSQPRGLDREIELVSDYEAPFFSQKIVRIIHSYTDYVNRTVWKKY